MKNPDDPPRHGRFNCDGSYRFPDGTIISKEELEEMDRKTEENLLGRIKLDCSVCGGDLPPDPDLSRWGFVCPPCDAESPDLGGG